MTVTDPQHGVDTGWRSLRAYYAAEEAERARQAADRPAYYPLDALQAMTPEERLSHRQHIYRWQTAVGIIPRPQRISFRKSRSGATPPQRGHEDCGCLHTYREPHSLRKINDWDDIRQGLKWFKDERFVKVTERNKDRFNLMHREHLTAGDNFIQRLSPYGIKAARMLT